ncbi:CLUMA_CG009209, isoform A [Clunio marinus]|uniref:CLUMA_CG009209, isoform A n=1 Tax=Clunio marinus TaxID=568069 RepID=A0A1J1I657_9DIPT|nr:CLUMA_CG009209, isoform A [Clunio marinus]
MSEDFIKISLLKAEKLFQSLGSFSSFLLNKIFDDLKSSFPIEQLDYKRQFQCCALVHKSTESLG